MTIHQLLQTYRMLLSGNEHIRITDTGITAQADSTPYLSITDTAISLFGMDVVAKLNGQPGNDWDKFESCLRFINQIKGHIVRLNHMGFGYRVSTVETEAADIRSRLTGEFELVEEDSGEPQHNRWFFVKHKTDRSVPQIELVLYPSDKYREYCPQFQIDIDTDLPYEHILQTADEVLGKDFFFWNYNIPSYGVVMAMGKIGRISGVNILVGIGTNLRKRQTFMK